ncbi:hypothetical protein A2867_02250 [Candidatus Daviesbacteria bacterium RIFCSPHIGHO2_01_FULL_40_11]|uniref:Uncharacterized protein n=1 Tax=Candidatus Daviesbacteria bacterium RIFCSPHIGHO2_01_FULL_40_11 TaxID=1797762 RepID=A0A1F5JLW9_9BACT|nr:MAG: hypothetical protein A2867_02250 [Candidatus Daviesbacteria bacterium RIFCSPHIGHO2_01_FULL_40_11]
MIIIAAVLVLIISAVISNQIDFKKTQDQKKILSASSSSTQSPFPTPTPSPKPSPSSNSSNNSQVTIKQEVKETASTPQTFNLSDFKYPNSSQVGNLENGIKLESSDDPNTITDWYQEKIRSLGFKSKSFVKTNTNGNILNKLVAASANKEVRVEIEKSAEVSKVSIAVTLIAT